MQAWERAYTSSAEIMFCPIAAAHHKSKHITIVVLLQVWDKAETYTQQTLSSCILHLHSCYFNCSLDPKCQSYYKQNLGYLVMDHALRHLAWNLSSPNWMQATTCSWQGTKGAQACWILATPHELILPAEDFWSLLPLCTETAKQIRTWPQNPLHGTLSLQVWSWSAFSSHPGFQSVHLCSASNRHTLSLWQWETGSSWERYCRKDCVWHQEETAECAEAQREMFPEGVKKWCGHRMT